MTHPFTFIAGFPQAAEWLAPLGAAASRRRWRSAGRVVRTASKGLRVTADEEAEGLDIDGHGAEGWSEFIAAH